jgi:hypothetical protein
MPPGASFLQAAVCIGAAQLELRELKKDATSRGGAAETAEVQRSNSPDTTSALVMANPPLA